MPREPIHAVRRGGTSGATLLAMTTTAAPVTAGTLALLDLLGPLFTEADDATAQLLLEAMEEADALATARERRAAFRVV
jgi:hypothetical protein